MITTVEPCRVVRIIARLNTGGPAIHTVLLTEGLDPGRFRSVLITGTVAPTEGDMSYYAAHHGVVPHVIPGFGRRVGAIGLVRTLMKLFGVLWRVRPHIVHTHTATAGMLGRGIALVYNGLARGRGGRRAVLVHTFHGHVLHGYFGRRRTAVLRMIERLLARGTDRIIAVSDAVKTDLVVRHRVCGADKITVVPLGFDFSWVADLVRQTGTLRAKHGIAADAVTLGVVARLTAIKNHELFLAALSRLSDLPVHGVIVGDGERRSALEVAVNTAGLGRPPLIFTGWEREQGKIYADLDIVCLTSRNEGTPVALIEAMASGKPFVATDVGGVRDLAIGEARKDPRGFEVFANGIIVRPDDAGAFAAAIRLLVEQPATRAAMGARGQTIAMTRYSKERLIKDVESVYDALLGHGVEEGQCGR